MKKVNNNQTQGEELITRKDFLKKTAFSAVAGLFAVKTLSETVSAATVKDNTTKTGVLGEMNNADVAVVGSYVTSVSQNNGTISVVREAADTVPTANSNKMITSGGVKTSLETRIGDSRGSVNRPVYVNESGVLTPCNFWIE